MDNFLSRYPLIREMDAESDPDTRINIRERRRLDTEATTGQLAAKPAQYLSLDERAALDRQRVAAEAERAARERMRTEELTRAASTAASRANPYGSWRESADKLDATANNWNQDTTTRAAALEARNNLYFNSGSNDAMARRIDQANDPASRFAAADAAQRKEWADTILAADKDGLVPGVEKAAAAIRQQRVDAARQGLGLPSEAANDMAASHHVETRPRSNEVAEFFVPPRAGNTPTPGQSSGVPPSAGQPGQSGNWRPSTESGQPVGVSSPSAAAGDDLGLLRWSAAQNKTPMDKVNNYLVNTAGTAMGSAWNSAKTAAGAVGDFIKPDVDAARAGVDWAVNRPQTPAAPETEAVANALGEGWRTAMDAGQLVGVIPAVGGPRSKLGQAVAQKVGQMTRPVVDVASQIGRNASRAFQGLPTYVEEEGGSGTDWRGDDQAKRREMGAY